MVDRRELMLNLARCAAARGHLAAVEEHDGTPEAAAALRRRYWREMAASALLLADGIRALNGELSGHAWPEADALGGEP